MIDTSFSTGQIDKGDTKTLTIVPKDSTGSALTPASITATLTPPNTGTKGSYTKTDFTSDSGEWSLEHTFDEAGTWEVDIKVTDASGNDERETDTVYVHP